MQCHRSVKFSATQMKGCFLHDFYFKKKKEKWLNETCSHTMAKLDICFDFFYEWIKVLSVELAIYLICQLWSMIWLRRLLTGTKTTCKIQMHRNIYIMDNLLLQCRPSMVFPWEKNPIYYLSQGKINQL